MVKCLEKGRALWGGTEDMRKAGEKYLPKWPNESIEGYAARLKSSWLFNGYKKAIRDMAGRVFDKPVTLGDNAPQKLSDWMANADLAGRDLSAFARDVFEDGLLAGIAYVMVDAPRRDGVLTRAQAEAQNIRPYLVHLQAEDILGWKTEVVGAATVLSQVRIMEEVTVPDPEDPWSEMEIDQVRVLDRTPTGVSVRLFRRVKDKKDEWFMFDEYATDMREITIAPFYANRDGYFEGEPLLEDLADVNIAHWQSQSDQRNILHVARVPILFGSGWPEQEQDITVGASNATLSSDPNAKLQWVEHSGQAIGAGRQDLKDLEFQMEALGLQLLVARPGAQSATGEALDARKESSQLSMIADNLRDTLEQCMIWVCQYGGLGEQSPSVVVNTDFGVGMMTAQEMTVLLAAVNSGNMDRETFLRELARRGMIAEGTDIQAVMDRLDTQAPALTGQGMNLGAAA